MVKPLFPYPGGKYKLTDWIVDHIPEHKCYVEPFGGGAAVLLNKPESDIEIYNDINSNVVTFFRVLRDRREELVEWLRSTPYSREIHGDMHEKLRQENTEMSDIERAGTFYYLQRSSFGGNRDGGFCSPRTDSDSWWEERKSYENGIERLEEIQSRLFEFTIENNGYREIIYRYDSDRTFFYCDPPYLGSEQKYINEFDHQELRRILEGIDGKWLLSYESVPDGYEDYRVVEKGYRYSVYEGDQKEITEKLIMNYNPEKSRHTASESASEVEW